MTFHALVMVPVGVLEKHPHHTIFPHCRRHCEDRPLPWPQPPSLQLTQVTVLLQPCCTHENDPHKHFYISREVLPLWTAKLFLKDLVRVNLNEEQ